MLESPSRMYRVVLPLLAVAFALSFVGRDSTASDGGAYWVGASGWFAFAVLLLVTLAFTVAVALRSLTRARKRAEAQS